MSWVHLRMCHSCGHIGCCDNSPGKHATAHHQETGHPLIRSAEPGEDWSWCYVDEAMLRLSADWGGVRFGACSAQALAGDAVVVGVEMMRVVSRPAMVLVEVLRL